MKIVIIGAKGTIGKHVAESLGANNQIIKVGSKSGDLRVDMTSISSIHSLFEKVRKFDALICTAGDAHFGPLPEISGVDFGKGPIVS